MRRVRIFWALPMLWCLTACQVAPSNQTSPQENPRAKAAATQATVAAKQQHLRELLSLAQAALAADRLKVPADDNAFAWYQQVLALDELNVEAHWGMQQITARYLQLAEQAFQSAQLDRAEVFLRRAESISASPDQIEALRQRYLRQIEQQLAAEGETLLPIKQLNQRSEALQPLLAQLAQKALSEDLRLLIIARSDAEGRWIYQQMRSAADGHRLRGNIELGKVPRIRLFAI